MFVGRVMRIVVGITGGIATGKSTVAGMFRELGAELLDADQIARDVLRPGAEATREVICRFGASVLDGSGGVDRGKLADLVFSDPSARDELNRITHPKIVERLRAEISGYKRRKSASNVLVVEIPLLYEGNLACLVEKVIVVAAEQDTQKNRLQMRNGFSSEQADSRIASQMPVKEKVKYADWVVDTETGIEATRMQVLAIWEELRGMTKPG